jgi:hypothetical protein
MLFNIEIDEGSRIVGYLVPDSFSRSPSLRITDGRQDLLVLPCQEARPALVASGRHETGRCGFTVDETIISGLSQHEGLELYDDETGILIYRRRRSSEVIQKRIFRLETHLFPLWRLDDSVGKYFQHFQKGIERHGRETTTQMFLLNNSTSLYFSGRIIFKAYENYIGEKFNCIALLHDPYSELAERLLTLKHIRKFGDDLLGERDMMSYDAAISFAEAIENDGKVLRRAFAKMSRMAGVNFADPLTRQLAARARDEAPSKEAIATALDTLSTFAIVGLRERQDLFLDQLADLLGTHADALPPIPELGATSELAEQLRRLPDVELLIAQDLEIYHHVKSALDNALGEFGAAEMS